MPIRPEKEELMAFLSADQGEGGEGGEGRRSIWTIGGGKGGTGKTFIAVNLGICLSRFGGDVVLVDTDLGGANIHTFLGLSFPPRTLSDLIKKRVEGIRDVVVDTEIPNLGLVVGAQDLLNAANPKEPQKWKLIRHINSLQVDYIILDLGAGNSFNVLDFFLMSENEILVVTPEPTCIENTYRFIKSAFFRKVKRIISHFGVKEIIDMAMDQGNERGIKTPFDIIELAGEIDKSIGLRLEQELENFKPKLIVNQVRTKGDIDIGFSIRSAFLKYFGISIDYVGYIVYDDNVWQSIKKRKPLVLEFPQSRASQCINEITLKLIIDKPFLLSSEG
ncbi:MAG: P-loop NTPase [Syntrophobacterales bacterium]|nr:MAG: P-loop NTPase [Syntrophobacterales bacterium]